MNDNLKLWNQFADIDPNFTKPISGKDYKGTSPNAHYVVQCLTEMFGPIGQGFGWRVLENGIERFGDTAIHWCRIEFWHTDRGNTFETYGQTKMAYMTRGDNPYLKVDEDAPKKSMTDAVTKAAAQVGVAANIFLGRWDDNQYVQAVDKEYRDAETPKATDGIYVPPTDKKVGSLLAALVSAIDSCSSIEKLNAVLADATFDTHWTTLETHNLERGQEVRAALDNKRHSLGE
jgi:hypothetical protein